MITGKTKSGFEFEVNDYITNDYEVLELIGAADKNIVEVPRLAKAVLGEEQANKAKEHLRNEQGYVPTDIMSEMLVEIINQRGEVGKNS